MNATGMITMTMREVDRFKVIQAVTEARLKPGQAAERLGLSVRQIERLVLRYGAAGAAGLVSGKRGRPSNHQLPSGRAQRALALSPSGIVKRIRNLSHFARERAK